LASGSLKIVVNGVDTWVLGPSGLKFPDETIQTTAYIP